jgi:hypothetical protein
VFQFGSRKQELSQPIQSDSETYDRHTDSTSSPLFVRSFTKTGIATPRPVESLHTTPKVSTTLSSRHSTPFCAGAGLTFVVEINNDKGCLSAPWRQTRRRRCRHHVIRIIKSRFALLSFRLFVLFVHVPIFAEHTTLAPNSPLLDQGSSNCRCCYFAIHTKKHLFLLLVRQDFCITLSHRRRRHHRHHHRRRRR